jgi:hypothetical protein
MGANGDNASQTNTAHEICFDVKVGSYIAFGSYDLQEINVEPLEIVKNILIQWWER